MRRSLLLGLLTITVVLAVAPGASARAGDDRIARLEAELARSRMMAAQASELGSERDLARSQRDVALQQRAEALAAVAQADRDARGWRIIGSLAVGAWLLFALAWWGRRHRTVRIRIPDTLEELLEQTGPHSRA
jgi:hypothetical protein